jgi:dihydrofolate synthase/folylpolyglutamate synthase
MDYQEAWQFLDDLQFFKMKLGLDSMNSFLERLDQPQKKLKFVHIAGTNGKGSTAAHLFSILTEAGFKVGLYSSPHLSSVRERFRINEHFISETDFARFAGEIITILEDKQITYFEFTTTLALLWFAAENVDLVLMEVGMGGRLDATNVIKPYVTVITNVSMDHELYLGNSLTEVATEKAGIIKAGIPVVSGAERDDSLVVIEKKAQEEQVPLYLLGRDFFVQNEGGRSWRYSGIQQGVQYDKLVSGLYGSHQLDNAALALAVLELLTPYGFDLSEDEIRAGLKKTCWPGRLEYFVLHRTTKRVIRRGTLPVQKSAKQDPDGVRFLLDGAHNPAGVRSLKNFLQELPGAYKSLICIWASMADKDIQNSLVPIAPLFDHILLTRPESERSAKPEDIKNLLPESIQEKAVCFDSVPMALQEGIKIADPDDLICVAGSLYLVGKARHILLGELAA